MMVKYRVITCAYFCVNTFAYLTSSRENTINHFIARPSTVKFQLFGNKIILLKLNTYHSINILFPFEHLRCAS